VRRHDLLFGFALFVGAACRSGEVRTVQGEPSGPIAIATEGGRVPLTFLAGPMEEAELERLREVAPNLQVIAGLSQEEALARAGKVQGIDGRYCTKEFLAAAPNLVWVQAGSSGVERYLRVPGLLERDEVVLTNLRGAAAASIADHAFALLLALTRRLEPRLAAAHEGRWERQISGDETIALEGRTLLVAGLGSIGYQVARRGAGFGMRVIATRRTAPSAGPLPDGVERVETPDHLLEMLAEADVAVICLPLTAETEGLFSREAFAALKPGAFLINVSRGKVVDTDALLDALDSGRLAGAGLDVTDPEPLPADHPLWRRDYVVITPHVAGDAALSDQRGDELYFDNLRRFAAGEPLLNPVDKRAGY
jgi:phosphoglycerate dehydrogenase-like enzyme